jgi:hypothetical protein
MDTPVIIPPKSFRGKINNLIVIVAFALAFMVLNTRAQCIKTDNTEEFKNINEVNLAKTISVIIVVFSLLLLGYDLAKMVRLF